MKKTNRIIFLPVGLMIMFLCGTVYAWSIISRSTSATFPYWNAQTLSMTLKNDNDVLCAGRSGRLYTIIMTLPTQTMCSKGRF